MACSACEYGYIEVPVAEFLDPIRTTPQVTNCGPWYGYPYFSGEYSAHIYVTDVLHVTIGVSNGKQ